MIEINKVRQIVYASPFKSAVLAKAGANGFERRTIRPNLGVAIHAGLRRRNSCKTAFFNRGVTVTAIDAYTRHMMLVAERYRLHPHYSRFREVGRPNQNADHSRQSSNDEDGTEDTDL
jgi:hypothetical protein